MSFANSGGDLPSPSTSIGPLLIKGDPSKITSAVNSVTNSGDVELKETSSKLPLYSSYVISTSRQSPSYLLGERDGPDGNHNQVSTTDFCKSRVRSLSYKSLSASISDMESVVRWLIVQWDQNQVMDLDLQLVRIWGEWLTLFNKEKVIKKFDESTATSHNKRPRSVVKCALSHEIKEINQ